MNENAYRARAERGLVQIGTWVNYGSDAGMLRSAHAPVVEEIRRTLTTRPV